MSASARSWNRSAGACRGCRRLPAVTRDGVEITLEANLELPRERELALAAGAQGFGLVRTEFLYMNRDDLPDEDDQYAAYAALVRGMEGKPVTLRTLDIGGDKLAGQRSRPRAPIPRSACARCGSSLEGAAAARRAARGDAARQRRSARCASWCR